MNDATMFAVIKECVKDWLSPDSILYDDDTGLRLEVGDLAFTVGDFPVVVMALGPEFRNGMVPALVEYIGADGKRSPDVCSALDLASETHKEFTARFERTGPGHREPFRKFVGVALHQIPGIKYPAWSR